jgi:hypothetical protein
MAAGILTAPPDQFKEIFVARRPHLSRNDWMHQRLSGGLGSMTPSERHHRLTQIFIAVCNLPGEERRRELDRLCLECPDLRAELELLLSFHDSVTHPPVRPDSKIFPS